MSKTPALQLREDLEKDGILLKIHPYGINITGYQIELVELKVRGPYDSPTFKFKITGIRVEKIAESYTLAFYYNVRGYNSAIQDAMNDYFNPQMRLGGTEDKYKDLISSIQKIHYEYKRDTKDIDLFMLQFTTISSKYDEDREGQDVTIIEGSVLPTDFVELVKLRRNLDGEKRFAALLTDDEMETIKLLETEKEAQKEARKLNEKLSRDPLNEFKTALEAMRDEIGKDKTYAFIKEAMEVLIATPTFRKKVVKKALEK